jgi:hypothetical protein
MGRQLWFVICCALAALTVGCSDESGTGGAAGSGGAAGAGGTGGVGGADTVTLSITATEAQSLAPIGPALEGVTLCQTDTTNCATTDAAGAASIEVPANKEISYTLEKDGYTPYLVADVTDDTLLDPSGPWAMYSEALTEDFFNALGIVSPTGGIMGLRAVAGSLINGIAGVTFEIVDETATPFYNAEGDWAPSFELTATTSIGQGGFVEQPDGEYQVEYGGTAMNCSPQIAWPGSGPNQIKVPVKAGYLTFSTMDCDEP